MRSLVPSAGRGCCRESPRCSPGGCWPGPGQCLGGEEPRLRGSDPACQAASGGSFPAASPALLFSVSHKCKKTKSYKKIQT